MPVAEPVAWLFPPQERDWSLPAEGPLTPRAARRVAREGGTQPVDKGPAAKAEGFGAMVHVEAERRGLQQAQTVLVLGDGGNWIDPLTKRERLCDQRIVDYYHAVEHLYEAAAAARGRDTAQAKALATRLKNNLWNGRVDLVIAG